MALPRNGRLLDNARSLRREMTKEERHLWYDFLRTHPAKFYRQKIVGNYILDFYCHTARLAIELDGSHHYEQAGQAADQAHGGAGEAGDLSAAVFQRRCDAEL